MKRQIVNYVTFIRGEDPRYPKQNMVEPVQKQIKLLKRNRLEATFLLQYDALLKREYTDLLQGEEFEKGVWFEMNQPHVESACIPWRGKATWDSRSCCAMGCGYTLEERTKLVDVLFEKYKEVFGEYPTILGSWAPDTFSVAYACEKYGLDAVCLCKEQCGTDGYTLWGGYYGQGYYPNKNNIFAPANDMKNALPVPVFRMLGADPVLQYDYRLDRSEDIIRQGVITLEPVYKDAGGGVKKWVNWFMKNNFGGNCLSFGYAQAGQENSFSWRSVKRGLKYQIQLFSAMQEEGILDVERLGETGNWYKHVYKTTPPSSLVAENDWQKKDKKSYWYCCKNYRINIYIENGLFRIRDIYLFRDDYKERYFDSVCQGNDLIYDNLPVMDGVRFSGKDTKAGFYLSDENGELYFPKTTWKEEDNKAFLTLENKNRTVFIAFSEEGMTFSFNEPIRLTEKVDETNFSRLVEKVQTDTVRTYRYNHFEYSFSVTQNNHCIELDLSSHPPTP